MITDEVLFIDAEALVINKPAGLAVHPGPKTPYSLENMANSLRFGFARKPTAVHRLDRDTSGCLLMARHPRAHRRLSALFEQRAVSKTYWAVLDGVPEGEAGLIDLPLAKYSTAEAGWRMIVDEAKGKASQTRWKLLGVVKGRALVAFEPLTGRTHQLRVHAATGLGIPIAGDPVYGTGLQGAAGSVKSDISQSSPYMMLHARQLIINRGEGRTVIDAIAPLPEHFLQAGFETGMVNGD